jgi:iron complex outermembrane receptor protein
VVGQSGPDASPLYEALVGESAPDYTGTPNYVLNGQSLSAYNYFQTTDLSEALFGDLTLNISHRLKLDAGLRVEHQVVEDQKTFTAGFIEGGTSSETLADQVANPVTPRFSLTYQLTDTDMVYASAAKGYRPGGGNPPIAQASDCAGSLQQYGLTSVPLTFSSDTLWQYEVGSKDSFFDRRLGVEGSVFYTRWSNIQTGLGLPTCNSSFTGNAGLAVSQGFDLQLHALLVEGWKVSVLVGYSDAYYPNATYSAPDSPGTPPVLEEGAGDKVQGVRPWDAAINSEYSRDIGSLWAGSHGYLRADYRWLAGLPHQDPLAAYYSALQDSHLDQAYGMLNLRAGIKHGPLDISAYVNNANNANPLASWFNSVNLYGSTVLTPRTIGVTAWYRF